MLNIFKPYQASADLFKILAHPVRLKILSVLREDEQCVCHIEAVLKLRQAYISHHLKVLKNANIIAVRREGWNMFYHVAYPEVYKVIDIMFTLSGQLEPVPQINVKCPCSRCHSEAQPFKSGLVIVSKDGINGNL